MKAVSSRNKNLGDEMTEKYFEVYYFKDYNAKSISPHYHDFYELYFYLSGDLNYIIGQELYKLRAGDLLFIPPGIIHHPLFDNKEKSYERIVVWFSKDVYERICEFDPDILNCMDDIHSANYLIRTSDSSIDKFNQLFFSLFTSYENRKLCYISEGLVLIESILIHINRVLFYEKGMDKVISQSSLLTDMLQFIDNHLNEKLTLTLMEEKFSINKFYIARMITQKLGIPFYQYITRKRLLLAKENMLIGCKINQLHETCGFSDYSCFYRAFRKEYGISPKEFIKDYLAKNQS